MSEVASNKNSNNNIVFPKVSSETLRTSPVLATPAAPTRRIGIFRPMLASDGTMERFADLLRREKLYASPKIDGIRCMIFNGEPVSRTLKPIRNASISNILKKEGLEGFDGELVVGNPYGSGVFARTSSGVMSHSGFPEFTYYVFDLHNLEAPYKSRLDRLIQFLAGRDESNHVQLLPQIEISTVEQLEETEARLVAMGYEGVILRRKNAPYKYNRSTLNEGFMLKLKRFRDSEGRIVGFIEQQQNANEAALDLRGLTSRSSSKAGKVGKDTLGALRVQDLDNEEWLLKVGTGFDAALRDHIWANQDQYLNRIIKYRYFPVGTKDLPRHPSFVGFRDSADL